MDPVGNYCSIHCYVFNSALWRVQQCSTMSTGVSATSVTSQNYNSALINYHSLSLSGRKHIQFIAANSSWSQLAKTNADVPTYLSISTCNHYDSCWNKTVPEDVSLCDATSNNNNSPFSPCLNISTFNFCSWTKIKPMLQGDFIGHAAADVTF